MKPEKEEKIFTFSKARYGDIHNEIQEEYTLKESELDDKHIDLLLGNLINEVENSPLKVKIKYIEYLIGDTSDEYWKRLLLI